MALGRFHRKWIRTSKFWSWELVSYCYLSRYATFKGFKKWVWFNCTPYFDRNMVGKSLGSFESFALNFSDNVLPDLFTEIIRCQRTSTVLIEPNNGPSVIKCLFLDIVPPMYYYNLPFMSILASHPRHEKIAWLTSYQQIWIDFYVAPFPKTT